ncbi:hypothetical protein FRC08_000978 [Ceratobasidium sp. 394]|nr:hypothetical protein FRC08_000978 [Ceratobasidium sp. 394]
MLVPALDPDSSDNYTIAFHVWMSARIQLTRAIEEYSKATIALSVAFLAFPANPLSRRSFNHALAELDQQLPSTFLDEQKLRITHSKLNAVRNRSLALVPINTLPQDLLFVIFKLSSRSCLMDTYETKARLLAPSVIPNVCSSWRQFSLSISSFWSHIDIDLTQPADSSWYLRAGLWVTRSQSANLHLHLSDSDASIGITGYKSMTFLRPLFRRVTSLEVDYQDTPLSERLLSAISRWIRHGPQGSAQQLEIWGSSYYVTPDLRSMLFTDKRIKRNKFEAFFQSLHKLHLGSTYIPLDSAIYHGLVELSIRGGDTPEFQAQYSQSQLAAVLAACPRLRTLKLVDFAAIPSQNFSPSLIPLNNLRTLALQAWRHPSYNAHILALISSNSPSLDVSIHSKDQDDPTFVVEVRAFFARCRVTRLLVNTLDTPDCLTTWLGHIPHVQVLALGFFDIPDGTLQEYINANTTESGVLDPWPRLQSLVLRFCKASQDCIQQLVSMHPLQDLHIVTHTGYLIWGTEKGREKLEHKLRASVPRVVCTGDSHNDPTDGWSFI